MATEYLRLAVYVAGAILQVLLSISHCEAGDRKKLAFSATTAALFVGLALWQLSQMW
jgi:hypothetical protein